ncbi:MAG: hypothetical protein OXI64_13390, partial [Defluviicoccus sp.]|nr:hypothetical protein [Defluviicoccus sp.]
MSVRRADITTVGKSRRRARHSPTHSTGGRFRLKALITIALDAMGGDNAPRIVVRGANIARRRYPDVRFRLFGDERKIAPL